MLKFLRTDTKLFTFCGISLYLSSWHKLTYVFINLFVLIAFTTNVLIENKMSFIRYLNIEIMNISVITMMFTLPFIFVILHEYGHSLMAKYLGVPTGKITIYPIGGLAEIDLNAVHYSPGKEFLITASGPAVNLLLMLLALPFKDIDAFALMIYSINYMLFVFNMIPCYPMDGGRIVRSLLSLVINNHILATRYAVYASMGIAAIAFFPLSYFGFYMGAVLLIVMAVFGYLEYSYIGFNQSYDELKKEFPKFINQAKSAIPTNCPPEISKVWLDSLNSVEQRLNDPTAWNKDQIDSLLALIKESKNAQETST